MKLDPKLQAQLGAMFATPQGEKELAGQLLLVDIEKIQTAAQPRQNFDAASLNELENSIRELKANKGGIGGTGILQPLLVRAGSDMGTYLLTAGERRLRAAKAAGLKQVPVVVEGDDETAWEHAIIENLLRQDLMPLEEAEAIHHLMKTRKLSVRDAAKKLGKDKGYLENRLFLLKAPDDVKALVTARSDTVRHAREIAKVESPKARARLIEATIAGAPYSVIQEKIRGARPPVRDEKPASQQVSAHADTSSSEVLRAQETLAGAVREMGKAARGASTPKARRAMIGALEQQIAALQKLITLLQK